MLIYGTGFQPSRFLTPMKVVGAAASTCTSTWDGDAAGLPRHHRAGLPQLLHALRAEHEHRRQRQHHLVLGVRGALRARRAAGDARRRPPRRSTCSATCTTRTTRRSTPRTCAWCGASSTVNSWYKNANGRVAQNWPFPLLEFWKRDQGGRRVRLRAGLTLTKINVATSRCASTCSDVLTDHELTVLAAASASTPTSPR